ncbi:response regulator [candidate division KSB1 bacterium]
MVTQEKKLSILIAESDPDLLNCLKLYLNENYSVTSFQKREDIVRHSPAAEFLLLDSRLVLYYGMNFLKEIKSASRGIHIVIMGDLQPNNINDRKIFEKTVTRVIHKPFQPEEIDSVFGNHA